MITNTLRKLATSTLKTPLCNNKLQRNFFGLFRRGRDTEVHKTIIIDKSKGKGDNEVQEKKDDKEKQAELELIRKRDQYFMEIRAEREMYEKERDDNKKNIDYASLRSRREFEVTVNNLDYSKIMIQIHCDYIESYTI